MYMGLSMNVTASSWRRPKRCRLCKCVSQKVLQSVLQCVLQCELQCVLQRALQCVLQCALQCANTSGQPQGGDRSGASCAVCNIAVCVVVCVVVCVAVFVAVCVAVCESVWATSRRRPKRCKLCSMTTTIWSTPNMRSACFCSICTHIYTCIHIYMTYVYIYT